MRNRVQSSEYFILFAADPPLYYLPFPPHSILEKRMQMHL